MGTHVYDGPRLRHFSNLEGGKQHPSPASIMDSIVPNTNKIYGFPGSFTQFGSSIAGQKHPAGPSPISGQRY